jgi:uncharacterized membrane protein YraQ (UPF0718 family)
MSKDVKKLLLIVAVFLGAYFMPLGDTAAGLRFKGSVFEALAMLSDYARQHVLLCLVPAFFIAGGISVFVSQASVIKYFGAKANKILSYSVASISGTILAVCSCTVLPLFASIYSRGAGIGPATAFLYSGPAINVLAIILSARVLGMEMGIARAVGAVTFSVIIGLSMSLIFRKEEASKAAAGELAASDFEVPARSLWKEVVFFASMVGILVFANWAKPGSFENNIWSMLFSGKWILAGGFVLVLAYSATSWFGKSELSAWVRSTWEFALIILPLLFFGVLISGFLFGRPGHEALIPSSWVTSLAGGNSLWANLFASVSGALMYFATLTEVPILQGLMGAGMGKGPALALLLAGPALSLPSMIVIRQIMGTKKMLTYVSLVVILSTVAGMIYGSL